VLGSYVAYWRAGAKNTLVVSSASGVSTKVYLNGSLVTTSFTAWTPGTAITLYIGQAFWNWQRFVGTIHSLEIRSELLDQQDVDAIQDNSLYTYRNRSSVWLDCKDQTVIGGLTQTTDKSGHGRNFLLGDGTTAAGFPTFLNPGFRLDGANDYLSNPNATGIFGNVEQSIVIGVRPEVTPMDATGLKVFLDTVLIGSVRYLVYIRTTGILEIVLGNTQVALIALATYLPYWRQGGRNVLIIYGTSGNTSASLNGHQILASSAAGWTAKNPTGIYLGAVNGGTNALKGDYHHFSAYPFMLSSIQVRDITEHLLGSGK